MLCDYTKTQRKKATRFLNHIEWMTSLNTKMRHKYGIYFRMYQKIQHQDMSRWGNIWEISDIIETYKIIHGHTKLSSKDLFQFTDKTLMQLMVKCVLLEGIAGRWTNEIRLQSTILHPTCNNTVEQPDRGSC